MEHLLEFENIYKSLTLQRVFKKTKPKGETIPREPTVQF
jgi:hypothetical protein